MFGNSLYNIIITISLHKVQNFWWNFLKFNIFKFLHL